MVNLGMGVGRGSKLVDLGVVANTKGRGQHRLKDTEECKAG